MRKHIAICTGSLSVILVALMMCMLLSGCKAAREMLRTGLESAGVDNADRIVDATGKVWDLGTTWRKALSEPSPKQEYYVGRTVSAQILSRYKPCYNDAANRYLNVLGQTLARASDNPMLHNGYHFLIMDTEEVNAFSAPGGFIMVSRGMIRCCRNEDALAAVLAHEIGHVQARHGMKAVGNQQFMDSVAKTVSTAADLSEEQKLGELTSVFESASGKIISTLIHNGYSKECEYEADAIACEIMQRVGYNPRALADMIGEIKKNARPGFGFMKTHPDPDDRIENIQPVIAGSPAIAEPEARTSRFQSFMQLL
jgi:predicted Zn-dependent protease